MPKRGKKYRSVAQKVERLTRYPLTDAVKLVKEGSYANFDATVEMAVNLNVNPKHADQMVRGAVVLPSGTGKTKKVLVFARGDAMREAEEAGADYVGAEELAEKIQGGWLDFDVAIATPDMMAIVGKLGRVLGPRGLMPNPKVGTVTQDVAKAVSESKGGKVTFKVDKAGNIHIPVGKVSFDDEKLLVNIRTVFETLMRLRPASVKGRYVKNISLSPTMGPGIRVDIATITEQTS